MSWDLNDRIERSERGDAYFDYCLWPYDRLSPLRADSLRSSALLYHSFAYAGMPAQMLELCDRLQTNVGPQRTVWGVKWAGEALSWEFYFYDYSRTDRAFSTAKFIEATQGVLTVDVPPADDHPYFMFSVEVDARHLAGQPVEQIDLYVGNPGSAVSSGLCYGHSRAGRDLRNLYFFFNAQQHARPIREKIVENARIPWGQLRLDDILWPDMPAETIVCANKRYSEALYFSRTPVQGLLRFMQRLKFPAPLIEFAAEHGPALQHHYFDVGYDYVPAPGGIEMTKGSYYGLL